MSLLSENISGRESLLGKSRNLLVTFVSKAKMRRYRVTKKKKNEINALVNDKKRVDLLMLDVV